MNAPALPAHIPFTDNRMKSQEWIIRASERPNGGQQRFSNLGEAFDRARKLSFLGRCSIDILNGDMVLWRVQWDDVRGLSELLYLDETSLLAVARRHRGYAEALESIQRRGGWPE